jgi:hypothetical protein
MTNNKYTEIHTKILTKNGPFETQIPVAETKANIAVGNHDLMFDKSIKKFYNFKADGSPYNELPIKIAAAGTEFGPVLTSNF